MFIPEQKDLEVIELPFVLFRLLETARKQVAFCFVHAEFQSFNGHFSSYKL
jgi:hypothetical protein